MGGVSKSLSVSKMRKRNGRLVTPKICCGFAYDEHDVVLKEGTAPILKRFVGQQISNIQRWADKLGGYLELNL